MTWLIFPAPFLSFSPFPLLSTSCPHLKIPYSSLTHIRTGIKAEPECAFIIIGESEKVPGELVIAVTEGYTRDLGWFMEVQHKRGYYKVFGASVDGLMVGEREFGCFLRAFLFLFVMRGRG